MRICCGEIFDSSLLFSYLSKRPFFVDGLFFERFQKHKRGFSDLWCAGLPYLHSLFIIVSGTNSKRKPLFQNLLVTVSFDWAAEPPGS